MSNYDTQEIENMKKKNYNIFDAGKHTSQSQRIIHCKKCFTDTYVMGVKS